ncbi:hypothetical protein SAMN05444395_101278 [Flavobacterium fryxellicola]|uniref:T9SS sorting signal type C domain-containing protein n=1 Tax=Flavobacterium fryxellicola TaxID=249352 RepID=A0A167XQQ0_9FLAO|nr:T9SS sorting signal type C domain-containing protein [Flavobacterium fryxellicola]OAB28600.1 hypothetical protein FBFR_07890 [Flavobacterium fryxellicola]SHN51510.1 hypothetical protein SAMN05444395_101278 [Flavobacterium fryxellicola]
MIKKLRPPLFILLAQFAASLQTQKIEKNSNSNTDFPFEFGDLLGAFRFGFTVRKTLFFVVLLFSFIGANAATRTSTATGGTWATGSTWIGGVAPVAGDDVVIATTGANVVTVVTSTSIVNVTINAGATLNIANRTLTTAGFFVNNGTLTGTTGILALTGNFTNNGVFTLSSGQVNVSTGSFSSTGSFVFSGAGILKIGGAFAYSGTFTLGTAAVQFTGMANQSIPSFTTTGTVSMLKTGGGVATFTGNVSGGGLTINGSGGTLDLVSGTHTFSGTWTRSAGTLNCGSSTLKVGGNVSGTGGAFAPGTGTVVYYRGGNQAAGVFVYNNLIVSGTGQKTFGATPTVNGKLTIAGTATASVSGAGVVTYGPNATLEYNTANARTVTPEEWVTPFTASGGVVINTTQNITLNTARTFNNSVPLTVNSGGKLLLSNLVLTLNGDLVNNGGSVTGTGTTGGITIAGTVGQNIGAFTTTGTIFMVKTSGTATFTGPVSGGALTINGSGGTLNLGSGLVHTASGIVTLSNGILNGGSSRLNVTATSTTAWNGSGANFVAGTGTVNFNGATQTLAAASTFHNLIVSNSGIKTLTGIPTINGILSMEGTATVSAAPIYGSTATLQYNRTASQVTGLEWRTPFTGTGGVSVLNTGIITVNDAKVFGASSPLTIATGATLDNGGFELSGGSLLTVNNGGLLRVTAASTLPLFTNTNLAALSTVEYGGAAQTVATRTYGNLILSGTGNKTFPAASTIMGDLKITSSAIALLSSGFSSAQSLTFGTVLQSIGSWGGTASEATNRSVVRFGSTTTGILNVNVSCIEGTWIGNISSNWNTAANWCGGILPSSTTDVIITSTSTNQPLLGSNQSVRNVTISSGATLSLTGTTTLNVRGNWDNKGTFVPNSSTVNFNGTLPQVIGGTTASTFHNLTNSNGLSKVTAAIGITVNNLLNISISSSVLDMSSFVLTGGGAFSNSGSGQILTANNAAMPIPAGKTWNSTVVYNNPLGGQTIVAGTYNGVPSLELQNTSGTQTASGNITTGNKLNIVTAGTAIFTMNGFNLTSTILNISEAEAVLDMKNGTLAYTIVDAMDGTIRFSGASNGLSFPSGTIDYYGVGQTVAGGNYYNLLFSGIAGSYTIVSDIDVANKFNVHNGGLTVDNSVSLNLDDAITVVLPGTMMLKNNASLVQTTFTGTNAGRITVQRNTTPIVVDDFTYWSSPTKGTQTLLDFSPNTQRDKYFQYNNDWANVNAATTVFAPGIGYAIRAEGTLIPPGMPAVDDSLRFIGVPNNGTIDIPVTVRASDGVGERLIGNPYPSAIDADAFINANLLGTGTINQTITGTLYFWTHNHTLLGNDYLASDYATYNLFGGVGVGSGTGNLTDPSQYIASGQGFFIENDVAGNVTFDNSMRIVANNTNFYRQKKTKNTVEESHRIWLKLQKGVGDVTGTLVGYGSNSTDDFDPGYDSYVYDENQVFALYSFIGLSKMAIQSKSLPFVDTDRIPMGYSTNASGTTTISIDKVDGLFSDNQNIYLEDKVLDVIHNLKEDPYSFQTEKGTFNERFVLRYTDKTLASADFELNVSGVFIAKDRNELNVKSVTENVSQIAVFDLLGRKIFEKKAVNSQEFRTSNIPLNKQAGIVKVTLSNGQVTTKKVIF